jgi:predicted naringenin-chalcone synthase
LRNTRLSDRQLGALDAVICINSTEMLLPGAAEILGSKYGVGKASALRFNLVGHGCAAVIPALQLAQSLIRSGAATSVAVVASEPLVNLHNHHAAERSNLITRVIFGEGAAALILSDTNTSEGQLPAVLGFASVMGQESLDHVRIGMSQGLWAARVDHQVPSAGKGIVADVVETVLREHDTRLDDVRHWAFHTGGRAVLDGCQAVIGLSDAQMAPSREVLRTRGNMQSCSVLFSLAEVCSSGAARVGDRGALVAIGPGMLAGAFLLTW